jgi:hypothetical protein
VISGRARLALALVVLGPLGGAAWLASRGIAHGGEAAATERWTSSAQCAGCHPQVYAEWKGSHHQIAYLNPEVRKLSDDFKNKECQACHLPRPVFVTGLGNRTLPRVTRPDEGVDCLTCHLSADGAILARRARPDVPCAPRADAGVVAVEMCQSCHNQHKTTDQWRASAFAEQGKDCASCHMLEAARPGTASGKGRSHVYPGAHDEEMLRAASRLDVARDGEQLVVTVKNVAAGHNFPTEERHRAVDIVVRFEPSAGNDWERLFRFRQPYRDEPGENTQLPAGQSHVERVWIPKGKTRATVRLWYRLNPYAVDGDGASTLLFERPVDL